jgi:quinol monooxygenase YgiN
MIVQHKKREFENTVKYACGMMPVECAVKNLSVEIFAVDTYYFFSEWTSETALRKFTQSEEYQLIRSAFDVLGVLHKIDIGFHVEIKTIRINH